jgi:hypothetical protein
MIQTQQIPVLEEDERIRWARQLTDIKDKATSKDASTQPHDLGFGSTIDQCFPKCTVLLDAKRTVLSLEAELGTIQTSHRCRLSLEEQETPFKKQMAAV